MRILDRLPLVVTGLVALAAAVLAAVSTSRVALATHAVSSPWCALLVPAIIEGGCLTAGLSAWRRARAGLPAWPERILLGATLVLAMVTNAAHAISANASPLGVVLAASAPLILLACVEMLIRSRAVGEVEKARSQAAEDERRDAEREARRSTREAGTTESGARQIAAPSKAAPRTATPTVPTASSSPSGTSETLDQVRAILAENPAATGAEVAARIGKSVSQANRLRAEVRRQISGTDAA